MFSLFSGVYDAYFAPTKLNLLIVGAGGVGKTAVLERMKCTQFTRNKKIEKQQVAEYLQREVPGSFLPPQARGRTSSFSSNDSQRPSPQPQPPKEKPPVPRKGEKKIEQKTSRLSFLKCPAPMRYRQTHENSDSDDEEDNKSIVEHEVPPEKPDRNGMDQQPQISQESMQEVSLENDGKDQSQDKTTDKGKKEQVVSYPNSNDNKPIDEDEDEQCDLKPKSKMLPLHKIRPTSK
jgi:hypothetical protein